MQRRPIWPLAALGLLGAVLLAGCPDEEASEAVRLAPPKIRDYFFPSSSKATYRYEEIAATQLPGKSARLSTSSFQVRAVRLTSDEAELVYELTEVEKVGIVPIATLSLRAEPSGAVTVSGVSILGPIEPVSYPDAALSSKGATIVPASGSTPASVMARVAREKTSVPAGTFDAIQVKHQIGDRMPTLTWYGPGLGYWGLRETRTSTLSIDGGGVSTVSSDVILKTYTP